MTWPKKQAQTAKPKALGADLDKALNKAFKSNSEKSPTLPSAIKPREGKHKLA